ncbi:unnamed protein product [Closterium sp. Naga37s-1]|nr:unnamed protein product [Closterium sp. Naga37s-1]
MPSRRSHASYYLSTLLPFLTHPSALRPFSLTLAAFPLSLSTLSFLSIRDPRHFTPRQASDRFNMCSQLEHVQPAGARAAVSTTFFFPYPPFPLTVDPSPSPSALPPHPPPFPLTLRPPPSPSALSPPTLRPSILRQHKHKRVMKTHRDSYGSYVGHRTTYSWPSLPLLPPTSFSPPSPGLPPDRDEEGARLAPTSALACPRLTCPFPRFLAVLPSPLRPSLLPVS